MATFVEEDCDSQPFPTSVLGEEDSENVIDINVTQNVRAYRVISKCMQTMSNAHRFPLLLRFKAVGRAITKSVSIVETLKSKLIVSGEKDIKDILEQKNTLSSFPIDGGNGDTIEEISHETDMDVEVEEGREGIHKPREVFKYRVKSVLEISLILKMPCVFTRDYDNVS